MRVAKRERENNTIRSFATVLLSRITCAPSFLYCAHTQIHTVSLSLRLNCMLLLSRSLATFSTHKSNWKRRERNMVKSNPFIVNTLNKLTPSFILIPKQMHSNDFITLNN